MKRKENKQNKTEKKRTRKWKAGFRFHLRIKYDSHAIHGAVRMEIKNAGQTNKRWDAQERTLLWFVLFSQLTYQQTTTFQLSLLHSLQTKQIVSTWYAPRTKYITISPESSFSKFSSFSSVTGAKKEALFVAAIHSYRHILQIHVKK